MWNERGPKRGFTLIEMLLAIVVLGAGLAGVLLAFSTAVGRSGDPVVAAQMRAIGEELLEEIELKPYTPSANTAPSGCARDTYNDVSDYNGYSTAALKTICAVDGTKISPQLDGYWVVVSVTTPGLDGIAQAKRIEVDVYRNGESQPLKLVGWRTNYAQ
jgi:MSHA pilin protein MshD